MDFSGWYIDFFGSSGSLQIGKKVYAKPGDEASNEEILAVVQQVHLKS